MARENLCNQQTRRPCAGRVLSLVSILLAGLPHGVWAQGTKVPITPEPVGSGARALGQSAFIAVADDATAAAWNPAGLMNLRTPEASFVGMWRSITQDYSLAVTGASVDETTRSEGEINFMSYTHPIEIVNTDAVLSINYHQVYDFGARFGGQTKNSSAQTTIMGESDGAVSAYSLAGALSVPWYRRLALGASFNWYAQSLLNDYAWRVDKTQETDYTSAFFQDEKVTDAETYDGFRAYNFTFGLLWNVFERQESLLSLGVVYHTPFTADVHRDLTSTLERFDSTGKRIGGGGTMTFPGDVEIDFPPSIGAGLNCRLSDEFSVAFDVGWTQWSKLKVKYSDGERNSPVDDDALSYRVGGEYLFFRDAKQLVLACRGGALYEPRPVPNDTELLPVYGVSTGLGWTLKERFSLDFAYQFRWADKDLKELDDYRIREHLFVVSLITYFR